MQDGSRSTQPVPAITGIDHVLVGVRDLDAAAARWQKLGFHLTPRGRHIGWGTGNYCIMFEGDYIELLGIVDPAQFTNNLEKFLHAREGLMGLAFAGDDETRVATELAAAGLHPDGPKVLKRELELPGGTVLPEFGLVMLPREETPALSAFVVTHKTPDLVRQPAWLRHANRATGLVSMTVVVDDPVDAAFGWLPVFGPERIATANLVTVIDTGHGAIRFTTRPASPSFIRRWYRCRNIPHPGSRPSRSRSPTRRAAATTSISPTSSPSRPARAASCRPRKRTASSSNSSRNKRQRINARE